MTPIKPTHASGSTSAPVGLIGGGKVSAPTDVRDFGRVNPKSCKFCFPFSFSSPFPPLLTWRQYTDEVATADADPLGVDVNVTFDNVGGLDGRKLAL